MVQTKARFQEIMKVTTEATEPKLSTEDVTILGTTELDNNQDDERKTKVDLLWRKQ